MNQRGDDGTPGAPTFLARVWQELESQVTSGHIPGYVAAIRLGEHIEVHAGGRMATEASSPPMRPDTLFRLASVTKPFGGALTLSLIEDDVLALDDPIARWLPEAATPRCPSPRTCRSIAPPPRSAPSRSGTSSPGHQAGACRSRTHHCAWPCSSVALHPGPLTPPISADEFVARVAALPLAFKPGDGWLYDTGIDLLGALLACGTGKPLSDLLKERVTGLLGLASTTFGTKDVAGLSTAYSPGSDGLELLDPPDGNFAGQPTFEELSSGLVSNAARSPAVLSCAMADGGTPMLTPDSVALHDHTRVDGCPARKRAFPLLGPGESWGMATGVDVESASPWMAPGRWGWTGGTGTSAYVDPTLDVVSVLLTQRAMTGPLDGH